jgi:hypothetical protein
MLQVQTLTVEVHFLVFVEFGEEVDAGEFVVGFQK